MKTVEQLKEEASTLHDTLCRTFDAWTETQKRLSEAEPSAWIMIYVFASNSTEIVPVGKVGRNDPEYLGYSPSSDGLCRFILWANPDGEQPWLVHWTVKSKRSEHRFDRPDQYSDCFKSPGEIVVLPSDGQGRVALALDHQPTAEECGRFVKAIRAYPKDALFFPEKHRWNDPDIDIDERWQ
jgi:hypothetical protein